MQRHRDYGSLNYWRERYQDRAGAGGGEENGGSSSGNPDPHSDDHTDEWFIAWRHLAPILSNHIPKDSSVIDLGCGTSCLSFDMLSSHLSGVGKVLAIDDADGAIVQMEAQKARLVLDGTTSAARASFLCADASQISSSYSFVKQ